MKNLLDDSLSEVTQIYLKQKFQSDTSQNIQNMDLRLMCDKVTQELQELEQETAFDYLKVENEIHSLNEQVDQSDEILADLENILNGFKNNLEQIKNEMTNLSLKSQKMNVCIQNRKQLQKGLENFSQSVILEPQLIKDICDKQVNDEYMEHIQQVVNKLEQLKNYSSFQDYQMAQQVEGQADQNTNCIKELEPELVKLKKKACQKVKQFLIDKIQMLKKPKTNIHIIQNTVLLKNKQFTRFLREYFLDVYVEICNQYSEIMSRLYLNNFKSYVNELIKLQVELYSKNDRILSDNVQHIRDSIDNIKSTNLNKPESKSIYGLVNRHNILNEVQNKDKPNAASNQNKDNQNNNIIVCHLAQQQNKKFTLEQTFKSINNLLMSTVLSEYIFTLDFFSLKKEHNKIIFEGIFRSSLQFLTENIRNIVNNTNDLQGLLLIVLINQKNKFEFQQKNVDILDFYFEQINMIVWPRFESIFEAQISQIGQINQKMFGIVEKQVGLQKMHQRYIDIQISFYVLYSYFQDNQMLLSRINSLKNSYFKYLYQYENENEYEKIVYFLRIYDLIYYNMINSQNQFNQTSNLNERLIDMREFSDELTRLEKECSRFIDIVVDSLIQKNFGNLYNFVKQHCSDDDQNQMAMNTIVSQNQQTHQVSQQYVINIIMELNEIWSKRLGIVKQEINRTFNNQISQNNQIVKKLVNSILAFYNSFYKYVKKNVQNEISRMIPVHQVMKETKNIFNYDQL